jgi:hypothetical protein
MKRMLATTAWLVLAATAWAAGAGIKISKDDPISLFLVERTGQDERTRINLPPRTQKALLRGLTDGSFNAGTEGQTPLVSRRPLKAGEVLAAGNAPSPASPAGYVFLRTGADGSLNFTSEKGQGVTLKTSVHRVYWAIDKPAAFALARKAGAKYVLFAETTVRNTEGHRKILPASHLAIDASLLQVYGGQEVRKFHGSLTRTGKTTSAAARDAAYRLGVKMARQWAGVSPEPAEAE